MTKNQVLDLYYLDARSKLIDIAAFLDRLERAEGEGDFRQHAFVGVLETLPTLKANRARALLEALSDPTHKPIAKAHTKGAAGAWAQSIPEST